MNRLASRLRYFAGCILQSASNFLSSTFILQIRIARRTANALLQLTHKLSTRSTHTGL